MSKTANGKAVKDSDDSSYFVSDIFTITDVDKEGKKFDRVSRIYAVSSNHDLEIELDVNIELFPVSVGLSFSFGIAPTLWPGTDKDDTVGWRPDLEAGLADEWEYVVYGKVYKFDERGESNVVAYASFGGLLMALKGSFRHVSGLSVGECVYLMMRR